MMGLSSTSKEAIAAKVDHLFDRLSLSFVGNIPKLKSKNLMFSSEPSPGLSNLFLQAINNTFPGPIEQDMLKGLLESSYSYIEALRNKTKVRIVDAVDGMVKEAKMKKTKVDESDIEELIDQEMSKARKHFQMIVDNESTKFRNIGKSMQIVKLAGSIGDTDPSIFWVCVHDDKLCQECKKLHLMEDGITPRVWKMSELSHSYHKRGEDRPSIINLHVNDRCRMTYLTPGFSFNDKGHITYKSKGHNELEAQRKEK